MKKSHFLSSLVCLLYFVLTTFILVFHTDIIFYNKVLYLKKLFE